MRRIYLAAPFFNDPQRRLCADLETLLADVPDTTLLFSPRRDAGDVRGGATLDAAFTGNLDALNRVDLVLAVLEYALPNDQEIFLMKPTVDPVGWVRSSEKFSIPDTGTVWECGYAFAKGVPVVGYAPTPGRGVNLMLQKTLRGVAHTLPQLEEFFAGRVTQQELFGASERLFNWKALTPTAEAFGKVR